MAPTLPSAPWTLFYRSLRTDLPRWGSSSAAQLLDVVELDAVIVMRGEPKDDTGNDADVTTPATIADMPVIGIDKKAFFDLPNNKFIFDINDKENPVLQLGINNGLMMAAERLLESNMSIDKVVILLRLDANQEKILRMKYGK